MCTSIYILKVIEGNETLFATNITSNYKSLSFHLLEKQLEIYNFNMEKSNGCER